VNQSLSDDSRRCPADATSTHGTDTTVHAKHLNITHQTLASNMTNSRTTSSWVTINTEAIKSDWNLTKSTESYQNVTIFRQLLILINTAQVHIALIISVLLVIFPDEPQLASSTQFLSNCSVREPVGYKWHWFSHVRCPSSHPTNIKALKKLFPMSTNYHNDNFLWAISVFSLGFFFIIHFRFSAKAEYSLASKCISNIFSIWILL